MAEVADHVAGISVMIEEADNVVTEPGSIFDDNSACANGINIYDELRKLVNKVQPRSTSGRTSWISGSSC